MLVSRSCSWCHEMNPATERFCRSCQHEAHVCRMDCECPRCLRARRAAGVVPTPLAEVFAEGGDQFQRGTTPPGESTAEVQIGASTSAASENGMPPFDVKRTPVRAELAEQIRTLLEALVAEFGFDLHFSIWIGDGLVAASSPTDGFVLPMVTAVPPTDRD